jgi:hypothetical protein
MYAAARAGAGLRSVCSALSRPRCMRSNIGLDNSVSFEREAYVS